MQLAEADRQGGGGDAQAAERVRDRQAVVLQRQTDLLDGVVAGGEQLAFDRLVKSVPINPAQIGGAVPGYDKAAAREARELRVALVVVDAGVDELLDAHWRAVGGVELHPHRRAAAVAVGRAVVADVGGPGDGEAAAGQGRDLRLGLRAEGGGVDQHFAADLGAERVEHLRLDGGL